MKKNILLILALLAVSTWCAATDYGRYYKNMPVAMPVPVQPTIAGTRLSLTECGGVGDGLTMNTEAFAKAMSRLQKQGGGHLDVPAGVYLTGPIVFKDGIDLHLDKNAIIVFSPDKKDHYKIEDGKPTTKMANAISASKRKNVSITGQGTIDGNGEWWRAVKRGKQSDVEWRRYLEMGGTVSEKGDLWYPFNLKHFDNVAPTAQEQEGMRQKLVKFTDCENVLIQGVTVMNSPNFHINPQRCRNVIIDGVTVKCPWNAQNGDAIDIGNCKDVLIVNNVVDCGDDAICMKGGQGQRGVDAGPCENINIQDNHVYHGHGGFVIGSDCSGGMKNILVRNNVFTGTDVGLRFKSAVKRGGPTENIFIDHIYMTDIASAAVSFETTYWDNHVGAEKPKTLTKGDFPPDFGDIHMSDIVCRGCKTAVEAHGQKGMVHGVTITDSKFFYTEKAADIDADCDVKMERVEMATFGR